MKSIRIIAILLVLALSCNILCGCSLLATRSIKAGQNKADAAADAAMLRSVTAEVTAKYLSDPSSVTIDEDGVVTSGYTDVVCNSNSKWELVVTLDPDTFTVTATFGGHDIEYFDSIAQG